MRNPAADIRPARPQDQADIRELLEKRSMDGAVRLALTRDPDPRIAAATEGDRHDLIVARSGDGSLAGMGGRNVYAAWFRGRLCHLGYLGQLRIAPGRLGFRRLAAAFEALRATRRDDELGFDITAILDDNERAIRLLEGGVAGLPRYRRLRRLHTLVVSTRAAPAVPATGFRPARPADMAAIGDCLARHQRDCDFAAVWDRRRLSSPARCRGLWPEDFVVDAGDEGIHRCAAVWDQRGFKQARIRGYAPWLRRTRPLWNVGLRALGRPLLPRAPCTLALGYLSHVGCSRDDPGAIVPLMRAALARARAKGLSYLVITLAEGHPFLAPLRRALSAYVLTSWLYVVDWGDADTAVGHALASETPWPEGALL